VKRPIGLFEKVEMKMQAQYHITRDDPCLPHWPNGSWSVYQINGDQIADRIVREKVNPKGYYEGGVIARHSWCGYLGMTETFDEVREMIEKDQTERRAA
jgi:hypothetical protein